VVCKRPIRDVYHSAEIKKLEAELNAANAALQGKDDCIAELRTELEAARIILSYVSGALVDDGDAILNDPFVSHRCYGDEIRKISEQKSKLRAELDAAQTQSRCDLIDGEPGHQKLLCDRLQAELDAAQKETVIQSAMIEAMAEDMSFCPLLAEYPDCGATDCAQCCIKHYREQAEKAREE
jgi:hypothetical protein